MNPEVTNELEPRELPLTPDAKSEWIIFHDKLDKAVAESGKYYLIRRTANKGAEQVLRLAGILTVFDDCDALEISLNTLRRSIVLIEYYLDEAVRIEEMGFIDEELKIAEHALAWMRKRTAQEPDKHFSLQEVYQGAPSKVRSKKSAEKVLAILEEHNLIEKINTKWRVVTFAC